VTFSDEEVSVTTDAPTAIAVPGEAEPCVPLPAPSRRYDRSIVEGPLQAAVWKLAWPTMVANIMGGLQGIVDHAMVGHFVGYNANAGIGVALQIFIVVIVFIMSLFTGMSILVARFVGANDEHMADRTVYQAFLTASFLSLVVLAPVGYVVSPWLLNFVNATPAVQAEALPYLRISFVYSLGTLLFFMIGGALRSAGDARTPMILGGVMTLLNVALNVVLISGFGPIPAYGTAGAAVGTVIAAAIVSAYGMWKLAHGGWVVSFPKGLGYRPDWTIIRALFKFGLPTGVQGVVMNIGGVLMLAFIGALAQSAEAQAAFAISYSQLFSFVTWTAVGLLGAAATTAGQNLGAGHPDRAEQAVHIAARFGLIGAAALGLCFFFIPRQLLAIFGMTEPAVVDIGVQLLRVLSVSGLFVVVALAYTGGLQGTGDTRSPMYISIVSQILIPLSYCFVLQQANALDPIDIWFAILAGHVTRCVLSVVRFNQGKWRAIKVVVGTGEPRR
jgi:putative MATE family efflux protein